MPILVTGANGFIGSWTVEVLLERGADVAVMVRQGSDTWRIAHLLDRVRVVHADLANREGVTRMLDGLRPETVCHLAWMGVGNAHRNADFQVDQNLPAALHFIRACAAAGCAHFVGLGSQAEYGPLDAVLDETALPGPTTLYGGAKLAVCNLGRILAEQAGMGFAWLRLFSTYGPRDEPHWLIPFLIRTMLAGRSPDLTEGTQRWDYLYVQDLARAVAATALTPGAQGVFNLGSGEAHRVRDIAAMVRDLIDPDLALNFGAVPMRPDQVMHLQADISRLRAATGWRPATPLRQGLEQTIGWYRDNAP